MNVMNLISKLYQNIGAKIKLLAFYTFIVEALGAIVTGLVFLIDSGLEDAWWALLIIVFGPIAAFVGSWLLYGLGEIICKLTEVERNTGLAYKPDEVMQEYVQEERAKYEADEQARLEIEEQKQREAAAKAEKEAKEQQKRAEREAEEQKRQAELEAEALRQLQERQAEAQLRREEEKQARKEEMDKLAAIATPVRLNRFGEAACPKCNRDLDHKGKTEPQKCSKCGFVYKIIR